MKARLTIMLMCVILIVMFVTPVVLADGGANPVKAMDIDTSNFGPKIVDMSRYFVQLNPMDTSKFGPKVVNMPSE